VNDANTKQERAGGTDASSPAPASLGAVSLDSGSYARSAAELPAARGRSLEEDAVAVAEPQRGHRPALRFKMIVGASVAACVAIIGVAATQTVIGGTGEHASSNRTALLAAAALAPPAETPAPAASPAPSPSTAPGAHATFAARAAIPTPLASESAHGPSAAGASHAQIRLAHGQQTLTVDGKRASAPSVVVACGAHTVAVGAEKPRRVETPCGRTLIVDVGKSSLTKNDGSKHEGKAHAATPKKH
jgi:hypothetical protein